MEQPKYFDTNSLFGMLVGHVKNATLNQRYMHFTLEQQSHSLSALII